MASGTTIRIAATANVICIPVATVSGRAVVMLIVVDANANTAPMTNAPVMSPRLRDRLSMPERVPLVRADICHDGGVVGCLEQCIADGDDYDGAM
jgi:hypothetical protein